MIPEELFIREDEKFQEYIDRVIKLKVNKVINVTWENLSNIIFQETGISKSERTWRRYAEENITDITERFENINDDELKVTKEELSNLILEYKKERVKLSDERTQNNAYIRRLSREETLKEIAEQAVQRMSTYKSLLPANSPKIGSDYNEAISVISDWHYGICFDNNWNKFDLNICKTRIRTLLNETISFCYTYGVNKLHLLNLGDLIAGRIHNTIRLSSRIDMVTQAMEVSEILAEYISELTNNNLDVIYYDCFDNHSRLEPNKTESLELESFVRIISWYLKMRLKDNKNVTIKEYNVNKDIIEFTVCDGKYTVGAVHGHKDKPNKLIDNICMINKVHYDLLISAHNHHPQMEEKNEVMWISNGSLMGSDMYSTDYRLTSKPSQTLILCNEDSPYDYIHIVNL